MNTCSTKVNCINTYKKGNVYSHACFLIKNKIFFFAKLLRNITELILEKLCPFKEFLHLNEILYNLFSHDIEKKIEIYWCM